MSSCTACSRVFQSPLALHYHCRDRDDHAYCTDCERLFSSFHSLHQHLQMSSIHRESSDCDDDYYNDESEEEDNDSSPDEDPAYCDSCERWFISQGSLYQHLAASSRHNWCFACSRDFTSPSALQQHNFSKVHLARNLNCPLCSSPFKTPSAIALHLESGACRNISRHQVTAAIHQMRIIPTISIARRLQDGNASNRPTVTYSATERAFNGTAYECYLCHRQFRALEFLNAHLRSPAHDQDEFQCPKCNRKYKLISGLIQHIESEVCGAMRFQQVVDYTHDLTSQFNRLLTF